MQWIHLSQYEARLLATQSLQVLTQKYISNSCLTLLLILLENTDITYVRRNRTGKSMCVRDN
jgi:hypothetical protein